MRQQQGGEVVSLLLDAYREGAKELQNDAHGLRRLDPTPSKRSVFYPKSVTHDSMHAPQL